MTILNVTSKTTEQHLILHCNSTFRFRFRPYWGSWSASGCQISSKSDHPQWRYDVISIFKMAADAEQFYFRFRIWFDFGDVAVFRSSVSINKPNFIVITPLGLIVLKITLLNSVSVFTNFVIPKRDKQIKKNRNQYASSPRQCNTGRLHAESLERFLRNVVSLRNS